MENRPQIQFCANDRSQQKVQSEILQQKPLEKVCSSTNYQSATKNAAELAAERGNSVMRAQQHNPT
jgi:hypothetical protein